MRAAASTESSGRQGLGTSSEPREDRLGTARTLLAKLQASQQDPAALPSLVTSRTDDGTGVYSSQRGRPGFWRRIPCFSPCVTAQTSGNGGAGGDRGLSASPIQSSPAKPAQRPGEAAATTVPLTAPLAVPGAVPVAVPVAGRTTAHSVGSPLGTSGDIEGAKSLGGETWYDACSEGGSLSTLSRRATLEAEAAAGSSGAQDDAAEDAEKNVSADAERHSSAGGVPRALSFAADPGPLHPPPSGLPFINPNSRFVTVPPDIGLGGYWARVPELSTTLPMPIDTMLKANWMARRAHESIEGILMQDTPTTLTVKVKVCLAGLGGLHSEIYNKDGSATWSRLRRDLKLGRSMFRMWYTAAKELVFCVESVSLMGVVDHVGIEIITLSEDGSHIHCNQGVLHIGTGNTAMQVFVGRRTALPSRS